MKANEAKAILEQVKQQKIGTLPGALTIETLEDGSYSIDNGRNTVVVDEQKAIKRLSGYKPDAVEKFVFGVQESDGDSDKKVFDQEAYDRAMAFAAEIGEMPETTENKDAGEAKTPEDVAKTLDPPAGLIIWSKSRRTGVMAATVDASEAGLDEEGGMFVNICVNHGNLRNFEKKGVARNTRPATDLWCPECAKNMRDKEDVVPLDEYLGQDCVDPVTV